ncbi:1-aminocyclopropane-1-carboxylate deaminase/D-cysteine desulfhydrase [Vibrio sp. SCSIO 43136]|uniref:1-aminocyclopropane-1-carboxylate deaminase/D-cysteine desulfhydrase n=1 Tax=Vibrio sp. SCSIO 43136 TaxID=2819101 RepID=UPI002075EAC6|nr:1-aminocyclopropane-1-carboxylate deaminase/D-cysteine desulfhydrase [Vibrio sp. SCSIO 43136]USD64259.1 1-aminocyclopropane-1-carboxylate deaminase/D-cysteine desulfhydrase [Vibrio sp. SCSIO 43136]
MKLSSSPITTHQFEDRTFYLKRDDLLHSQFSGNKARKFMSLLQEEFHEIDTLISYGSAQANSLYSLATLAKIRGWKLEFYVANIPNWLKQNPIGNYRAALEMDAQIIETPRGVHPSDYITQARNPQANCLFVPEGGRSQMSEVGVTGLAREIGDWIMQKRPTKPVVALPSGTGTTSIYLQKYLQRYDVPVLTCACVGGPDYLTQQWDSLGESAHPTILTLEDKHHFGHLYLDDYQIWQQLEEQTYVEFDLLYDPMMWRCLRPWLKQNPDSTLIYVHQGGLIGNESMLPRYRREFEAFLADNKSDTY